MGSRYPINSLEFLMSTGRTIGRDEPLTEIIYKEIGTIEDIHKIAGANGIEIRRWLRNGFSDQRTFLINSLRSRLIRGDKVIINGKIYREIRKMFVEDGDNWVEVNLDEERREASRLLREEVGSREPTAPPRPEGCAP